MNTKNLLIWSINIIFVSLIIYLIIKNRENSIQEPFIGHLYRPHIRRMNNIYESFINNYGPNRLINQVKKMVNY